MLVLLILIYQSGSGGGTSSGIGSVGGLSVGSGIAQWHLLVVAPVAVGVAAVAALVVAVAAVAVALAEVV